MKCKSHTISLKNPVLDHIFFPIDLILLRLKQNNACKFGICNDVVIELNEFKLVELTGKFRSHRLRS